MARAVLLCEPKQSSKYGPGHDTRERRERAGQGTPKPHHITQKPPLHSLLSCGCGVLCGEKQYAKRGNSAAVATTRPESILVNEDRVAGGLVCSGHESRTQGVARDANTETVHQCSARLNLNALTPHTHPKHHE